MRAGAVAMVSAVLGLALVAGCGQNDEPKPLEEDSAAQNNAPDDQQEGGEDGEDTPAPDSGDQEPSPGEDGTPGGGGVGQEALEPVDAKTGSEVKALVQRYLDAYDKATATGEMAEVEKLYSEDCSGCKDGLEFLDGVYSEGGRIDGGSWKSPKITVRGKNDRGTIEAAVDATLEAFKVYDSAGKVTRSSADKRAAEGFQVSKTTDGWRVVEWTSN